MGLYKTWKLNIWNPEPSFFPIFMLVTLYDVSPVDTFYRAFDIPERIVWKKIIVKIVIRRQKQMQTNLI